VSSAIDREETEMRIIALVVVITLIPTATPAREQSGTCGAVIDSLERGTQRFAQELDADVDAFTRDELATASLNAMKTIAESRPAPAAAVELVERYREFRDFATEAQNIATQLGDLAGCLTSGRAAICAADWVSRQTTAMRAWFQALLKDTARQTAAVAGEAAGIAREAVERVQKAAAIYSNYVKQSLTMFQTGATNALGQCVDNFSRQAATEPVSTDPPQTATGGATSTQPPRSGGGSAKGILAAVAIGAGVTVGALALAPVDVATSDGAAVSTSQPTTSTPTGVRVFDGTYDLRMQQPQPGGGIATLPPLNGYVRVSNGAITSTDGRLTGSVTAAGVVNMSSLCPFGARDPATYRGNLNTSGSGTGNYSCVETPQYNWDLLNRR
jgi:hypothetical protein